MQRIPPPASPAAYFSALEGWQKRCASRLRKATRAAADLEEAVKWGHVVYFSHGPVLLIRAESARVLFGFWRGQRLQEIEPRLKSGGKYEMATLELREGDPLDTATVTALVRQAVTLNQTLGDPTLAAKKPARRR